VQANIEDEEKHDHDRLTHISQFREQDDATSDY
jgi:hypothetical protein